MFSTEKLCNCGHGGITFLLYKLRRFCNQVYVVDRWMETMVKEGLESANNYFSWQGKITRGNEKRRIHATFDQLR